MAIGILLVTHAGVGKALKETATTLLGNNLPTRVELVSVPWTNDTEDTLTEARTLRDEADSGDGVLVMTDTYGTTPANIATKLFESVKDNGNTRVVCGLNLSMLLKTLNYCQLDLDAAVDKALLGGREGIMECCGK